MRKSCRTSFHLSGMKRGKPQQIVKNCWEELDAAEHRVRVFSRNPYWGGCGAVACGTGCATEGKSFRGAI